MKHLPTLAGLALAVSCTPATAFFIQFDDTYDTNGFFAAGSDARDRLDDAGAFFESIIADDLDDITPGGGNTWNARISHPTNGGPEFNIPNLIVPADTIIIYVGARDLGSSTLGQAGPGGFNSFGFPGWNESILERGEGAGTTTGSSATDFAPWGGTLTMDSDSIWDYGIDDSTLDPTENHFYSVLLHEIAHVLGLGAAPSWEADTAGGEFVGAAAVAEFGGNVPLDTGDGHWTDDLDPSTPGDQPIMSTIMGTNTLQEVSMDASIIVGTVKLWTDLDSAALTDTGWVIIPEPSTSLLLITGLLGLATARRRRGA